MDNSWSQQQHQQQQQQQHPHHQQPAHHQQHHPQPPQSQHQQQQPHQRSTQQAQPPHSQRQQAPDSARSTGSAQASSYSQGGRTFGTINPNYRQAQSYNPSPTGNTHPPGQIHEAYKRSSAEGQSNNAPGNASSGRDVYSARANAEQPHGAAAVSTTGPTTATVAPAKVPAKRVRKPKQPAAPVETALPQDGPADGATGPPLPFDTKPLYTRLEQLTKTQTDLITYLHAELDRRRDWEEMMVKEMHQRHSVLLTLITTLVPVNGSLGQGPRPDGLSNNLSSTIGRAGLPGIPAVSAMGSMSALHEQEAPQSQAFEQEYEDEPPRPSGRSEPPAFNTPARTTTFEPNSARSAYSAYSGPSTPKLAGSKRARMDEDDYADLGKDANVEVDERGVIYMCGGRKMGIVPTKIQSLVRKSLYAAQGVPTGRIQLPLYISGMYPANGDEHWAFGNLRYDWHSTTRKSTHNSEMKRIVIEHIVSHRYAYAEIPDSEFSADRLDHAYEQSFNHWKSKFMGKKSSGIKTKRPKTIGIREIQKILDTVGTGDDSEMEHEDGAVDRNTSSIRAEPNSTQGMRIDNYTPTTNPSAPLSSGQPAPASDVQAPRPTAAT